MFSSSLDKFEKQMKRTSERKRWSSRLIGAGSDKQGLQDVLFSVLSHYWSTVSSQTALKKNLIDLSSAEDIDKLVESLNGDEVEELKNMVQKGGWAGLINHRMCLARFRRRYIVMRYWHRETSKIS